MALDQHVAIEVRAELGRQRINVAGLAREMETSEYNLRRRVKGEVPFSLVELERVAEVLGVPVTQFLRSPSMSSRFGPDVPGQMRFSA